MNYLFTPFTPSSGPKSARRRKHGADGLVHVDSAKTRNSLNSKSETSSVKDIDDISIKGTDVNNPTRSKTVIRERTVLQPRKAKSDTFIRSYDNVRTRLDPASNKASGDSTTAQEYVHIRTRLDTGFVESSDGKKSLPTIRNPPRLIAVTTTGKVVPSPNNSPHTAAVVQIPEKIRVPRMRFRSCFGRFENL